MKHRWAVTLLLLVLSLATFSCGSGNHLVSIAVTPNPATVNSPGTLQFQAIGTYRDGTTKVLSNATWTLSSSSTQVTLSRTGLATCFVQGGPALDAGTVTVSFAGLSASTTLVCSSTAV